MKMLNKESKLELGVTLGRENFLGSKKELSYLLGSNEEFSPKKWVGTVPSRCW
jgi:hypothetical protein